MPFFPSSPKDDNVDFERDHVSDPRPPPSPQSKPAPSMVDLTNDLGEAHNSSAQHNVVPNDDPALDRIYEHHHAHIHHDANAEKGREDEVVYSKGTTLKSRVIPHQDPQDHESHRKKKVETTDKSIVSSRDPEKGSTSVVLGHIQNEEDPQTHTGSSFYQRYRIYFHVVVWIYFTA